MAVNVSHHVAWFQLFGRLEKYLAPNRRGRCLRVSFKPAVSLKHLIESMGIPHTEVGLVSANGQLVDLDYLVQAEDRISVNPSVAVNCSAPPAFLLDNHLGKLVSYLRILGFDTLYRNDFQDDELAEIADQTGRILLTRDRHLLMRKIVKNGCCLYSLEPRIQLAEVLQRYHLNGLVRLFKRCPRCNGILYQVTKASVMELLEPLTKKYYDEFYRCSGCSQVYWRGSHCERMQVWMDAQWSQEQSGLV